MIRANDKLVAPAHRSAGAGVHLACVLALIGSAWTLGPAAAAPIDTTIAAPVAARDSAVTDAGPQPAKRPWWPPWKKKPATVPHYPEILVSARWLADRQDSLGVVVLDARPLAAFRRGHIPGALCLPPSGLPSDTTLPAVLSGRGLRAGDLMVCYADSSGLPAAARLFWLLELAGARAVRLLDGGLAAWQRGGGVLARGDGDGPDVDPQRSPGTAWGAVRNEARLATSRYLLAGFGQEGCEILDARPSGHVETAFALADTACAWFAGHIPHSLPFDFRAVLRSSGDLREPAKLRELVAACGPRPGTTVDMDADFTLYDDGQSDDGALGYLVLRVAGVDRVRYYPEGWAAWSADPRLPIVRMASLADVLESMAAAGVSLRPEDHTVASDPSAVSIDSPPCDLVLLDVRHDLDYFGGHLPGAANVPAHVFADSIETVLRRHWPDLDRAAATVILYCYGPECIRSRNGATRMAQLGFPSAIWFRGGVREWLAAGLPVVRSARP